MIIDVFPFFNELDVLEYRLKTLYNSVDKFVIVEGNITHAGNSKPSYFTENQARYYQYKDKICYFQADLPETKEQLDTFDKNFGMIKYGDSWIREHAQRHACFKALSTLNLQDDDIIIISDVDEIPRMSQLLAYYQPDAINYLHQHFFKQCIHIQTTNEEWSRAYACSYKILKQSDVNLIRLKEDPNSKHKLIIMDCGWHFSYFGNAQFMQTKLNNFAHQEQAVQQYNFLHHLKTSLKTHQTFSGDDHIVLKDDLSDFQGTLPPDMDHVLKIFSYCKNI